MSCACLLLCSSHLWEITGPILGIISIYQFASCVRTKVFYFLTDLAMFYWRFNCGQYVEIQFYYILLKIIDSFLLANSSTAG